MDADAYRINYFRSYVMKKLSALAVGSLLLLPAAANAHSGHYHSIDFSSGFAHPFLGPDHLLAMLASGIWAVQRGGRALLAVPAAFVIAMLLGALAGMGHVALPYGETAIQLTVLMLGAFIALAVRWPATVAALLVAMFAATHGYSHAVEMPDGSHAGSYLTGMLVATLLLHVIGIAIARSVQNRAAPVALRYIGTGIAAAGVLLLAA
jgi:urease accessory protein